MEEKTHLNPNTREAYRILVRHAALTELERLRHGTQTLMRILTSSPLDESLGTHRDFAEDRRIAESYCQGLGVDFATKFAEDVPLEMARLVSKAEELKPAPIGKLSWLKAIRPDAWVKALVLYLPLLLFCLWSTKRLFHLTGFIPVVGTSLAIFMGIALLALPMAMAFSQQKRSFGWRLGRYRLVKV